MSRFASLPEVSGCDVADLPFLDAIERAHALLDDAEKLFTGGERAAGMFQLGKAAGALEALGAGEADA